MGRNKIEIKKIEDKQTRNVTFTKRRQGLFKKAETASKMFGLQIGILTFSPAGKPFIFNTSNSSSFDSIIDTFTMTSSCGGSSSSTSSMLLVGNKRNRQSTEEEEDDAYDHYDEIVHETEKRNDKKQKSMNEILEVFEEEDDGFQRDLDQTDHLLLMNEIFEGFVKDVASTTSTCTDADCSLDVSALLSPPPPPPLPVASSSSSSAEIFEQDENYHRPAELHDIIDLEDFEDVATTDIIDVDGFEYVDHTNTSTSLWNSTSSSSHMNEEEIGGSLTLEEWEFLQRIYS